FAPALSHIKERGAWGAVCAKAGHAFSQVQRAAARVSGLPGGAGPAGTSQHYQLPFLYETPRALPGGSHDLSNHLAGCRSAHSCDFLAADPRPVLSRRNSLTSNRVLFRRSAAVPKLFRGGEERNAATHERSMLQAAPRDDVSRRRSPATSRSSCCVLVRFVAALSRQRLRDGSGTGISAIGWWNWLCV
ncbi:unnamed protein product, partial [Phaeothamnion confervicola]